MTSARTTRTSRQLPALLLAVAGLLPCGCASSDATLAARSADYGHCVALGPGRVATVEHVTSRAGRLEVRDGRTWRSGQTVSSVPLPTLPWRDAVVEVEVPGYSPRPAEWQRLGADDAGRGVYIREGGRWVCVGIYLGDSQRSAAIGVFAPPHPSWTP
tara:strand:+ start:136 stop:609 length:474 start_codon:yes stop_codon:yes gene_type:complete